MGSERSKNIEQAKHTFEFFVFAPTPNEITWDPEKDRANRTKYVLALMSYWRLLNSEYVFLNTEHLEDVINSWKKWKTLAEEKEYQERVGEWIQEYEERLKSKEKIGEIGERFVDLSSSRIGLPIYFSFILEYEAEPNWGAIIYDFRKLLSVLAPVKVGIFHLPKWFRTSKLYDPESVKTGKIGWEDKILDSSKPDELIDDMKNELRGNVLEHPSTVYLIMLIHSLNEKRSVYGYLLWRETTGKAHSEKLASPNDARAPALGNYSKKRAS